MTKPFGELLRDWRQRRRISQLGLALDAGVSQRHLSFMESGRSRPSREMVLALAERLEVPLRDRNTLLLAAGFAPAFRERPLDDPALAPARAAIAQVMDHHEPFPAIAFDRHWNLVMTNRAAGALLHGLPPGLATPPANLIRIALHPDGLAPRIANLAEVRAESLYRLRRQLMLTGDRVIAALIEEVSAFPHPPEQDGFSPSGIAATLRLNTPMGTLVFIVTTTMFGTPVEVTLAELAVEMFFPADEATAAAMRAIAAGGG